MKTNMNFRNASVTFFVVMFSLTKTMSTYAQSVVTKEQNEVISHAKNAENKRKDASEFNIQAKAVAMKGSINSPYAELKPAMTPGGNRLYFSRINHPDNTFREFDQEDIWFSDYDSISGTWSDPGVLPGNLNNAGPNFINSVSATGDTIILGNQYLKKGKMKAGLSYSVNIEGQWSQPKSIKITNDYNISEHANHYVSLKNGVIISAIQRCETEGERDLYVSFWNGEVATEPVNMGSIINSDLEESSPYLACDNKTLFFASKGHSGRGGYDIFVTSRLDDTWLNWSEPRNLGPAFNGPMNDEHFIITHCKQFALFSKQTSVHNVDLFKISIEELCHQIKGFPEKIAPIKMDGNPLAKL